MHRSCRIAKLLNIRAENAYFTGILDIFYSFLLDIVIRLNPAQCADFCDIDGLIGG